MSQARLQLCMTGNPLLRRVAKSVSTEELAGREMQELLHRMLITLVWVAANAYLLQHFTSLYCVGLPWCLGARGSASWQLTVALPVPLHCSTLNLLPRFKLSSTHIFRRFFSWKSRGNMPRVAVNPSIHHRWAPTSEPMWHSTPVVKFLFSNVQIIWPGIWLWRVPQYSIVSKRLIN